MICHACIELAGEDGEISDDKLMYGDWMRTSANAQQPKYVNGSLQRSSGNSSFNSSFFRHVWSSGSSFGTVPPAMENRTEMTTDNSVASATVHVSSGTRDSGVTDRQQTSGVNAVVDKGDAVVVEVEENMGKYGVFCFQRLYANH